jgi:hypothetical protein
MRKLLLVAAALCGLVSTAPAADKPMQMPIDFIGEWCQSNEESYVKGATNYKLPSWTEGGVCTRILSVQRYGFSFPDGRLNCGPTKIEVRHDTAPSGTAYFATVTAKCYPDGPVDAGRPMTFRFERYKGNLEVGRVP